MTEFIVFVDESGRPTGESGPKLESHHGQTKLHLAFSCYVFNEAGELLVTQRALSKKVWPGVWTNSFCGHPGPGESLEDAIRRRGREELGLEVAEIECVLPKYRYRTPEFEGVIENEFCPVFTARAASGMRANVDEVGDWRWVTWPEYVALMEREPERWSYWAKDQRWGLEGKSGLLTSAGHN